MTFQDFNLGTATAAPLPVADRLGQLEWDAVAIAKSDGPRSANPRSLLARLSRLFGIEIARPLANERLETLRRFAVRAWFRDVIRERDLKKLFDAGFTSNDAWRVLTHVATSRGVMPGVENWP